MNHIEKLENSLISDLGQEDKLQLDFNESHADYVKVSQYIQDKDLSWVSEKSRQAAIENEKMWKLQINEHVIHAHTLRELLIEKLSSHFDSLSEIADLPELPDLLSLLEKILLEKLTGQNSTIYISYSYILDAEEYEMSMKESKIITDKTKTLKYSNLIPSYFFLKQNHLTKKIYNQ